MPTEQPSGNKQWGLFEWGLAVAAAAFALALAYDDGRVAGRNEARAAANQAGAYIAQPDDDYEARRHEREVEDALREQQRTLDKIRRCQRQDVYGPCY